MSKQITSTLEKICVQEKGALISGPFGSNISSKYFVADGVPVIRGNNLSLSYDKFYDSGFVFVTKEKADELRCYAYRDDLIFTAAGTIGQVGIIPRDSKYEEYVISNKQIRARINTKKVDLLYAYYWFSSPWIKQLLIKSNKGSTVPLLTLSEVRELPICYPESLLEQRKIANCIESLSRKIENNNRINDNLQQQMCLIFENLMAKATSHKISGKHTEAKELTSIITGKEDANFSTVNGQYKFFTCSNVPLWCDEFAFESSSILIAGNGDFNVKHYSGKFNAYQRTYVLTPATDYYALLYLASLYRINSFKSNSSGSIVKFITKGDVETIPVFIPDDTSYLHQLNKLMLLQEQNTLESEQLIALRDWLLPMLMNGQATVTN